MKMRLKFKKGEPVKYISHLDLSRVFERAFRRAQLPIAFSQGFTPHPKISFCMALPVGTTSSGEYMDVDFKENISKNKVINSLNSVLPKGIRILGGEELDCKISLSQINCALYRIGISVETNKQSLHDAIQKLLNTEHIITTKVTKKRTKHIDIAPLIHDVVLDKMEVQKALLKMELSIGEQGNVLPQTVISELQNILGRKIEIEFIHREDMFFKNGENRISPL